MHHLLPFLVNHSYFGIFTVIGLSFLGFPMPDEILMASAGFLVTKEALSFPLAVMAALSGSICGVSLEYLMAKRYGYHFVEKYSSKLRINPRHLHKAQGWYRKNGKVALVVGYFIPGIRHLTAVFAGFSAMPFRVFIMYAFPGAFLWTATFVTMGYYLGDSWRHISTYSYRYILPLAIIAVVISVLIHYLQSDGRKRTESEAG